MTTGDYVFYTVDMLPDEKLIDAEYVWKGNDGRDAEARKAFEAVFHVSNDGSFSARCIMPIIHYTRFPVTSP